MGKGNNNQRGGEEVRSARDTICILSLLAFSRLLMFVSFICFFFALPITDFTQPNAFVCLWKPRSNRNPCANFELQKGKSKPLTLPPLNLTPILPSKAFVFLLSIVRPDVPGPFFTKRTGCCTFMFRFRFKFDYG